MSNSEVARAHESFVSARGAVRRAQWVEARLALLSEQQEGIAGRHEALSLRHAVEKDDVDDLESSLLQSLARWFSSSKADELDREKKEALSFKLQLDAVDAELAALDEQVEALRTELTGLSKADATLAAISASLAALVRDLDPELAAQLDEFGNREAVARSQLIEIDEAMQAGMAADVGLGGIMDRFAQSRRIEIATSIGDDLIYAVDDSLTTVLALESATHLHLHSIRGDMGAVSGDIVRFQIECKDVTSGPKISGIALEPMPSVLDFIKADLIGWHILDAISDASWHVEKTRDEVQLAYANLRHRRAAVEDKLAEVVEQKATLLSSCF